MVYLTCSSKFLKPSETDCKVCDTCRGLDKLYKEVAIEKKRRVEHFNKKIRVKIRVVLDKKDYRFIESYMRFKNIQLGYGYALLLEDFLNHYKMINIKRRMKE